MSNDKVLNAATSVIICALGITLVLLTEEVSGMRLYRESPATWIVSSQIRFAVSIGCYIIMKKIWSEP